MKDVGIVGLPQSGKTTLFNALTRAGVPAGGAAGKASVAAVPVPDPRVDVLSELERSRKRVFVQARFVDVAGLSSGGGLAAQGLGALREADALAMVLAAWGGGGPDPVEAAAELTLELTVADLESVAGGAEKAAKKARAGVKDAALEAEVLARARDLLDQGTPLRAAGWEPEEARVLRNFAPLTLKPALAVLNLAEADAAGAAERAAEAEAKLGLPTVAVAAALEAEAAELAPEDAADLLAGYGVERGGLDQVVGAAWRLLDLLTFLTTGEDETRAWEVRRGATAPEAAGRIHSDLQRGFIRAEVIGYDDVVAAGGWDTARSKGLLRTESKSYVVQEGDVVQSASTSDGGRAWPSARLAATDRLRSAGGSHRPNCIGGFGSGGAGAGRVASCASTRSRNPQRSSTQATHGQHPALRAADVPRLARDARERWSSNRSLCEGPLEAESWIIAAEVALKGQDGAAVHSRCRRRGRGGGRPRRPGPAPRARPRPRGGRARRPCRPRGRRWPRGGWSGRPG